MRKAKQSTAKNVMVLMVDSTDHITGKAGLTLTITASKNGGAFGSISPTVTERGDGWYSLSLTASHTDTLGDLALHITGTAADPADMVLLVEARSVDDVSADTLAEIVEGIYTLKDVLRLVAAVMQGDAAGLESGSPVFKSIDGTKDRVAATYAGGARTVTSRDVT